MGLIYGPKIRHIIKVPPSADEVQQNGNVGPAIMSKIDQKRYDMLKKENETLQKQIEEVSPVPRGTRNQNFICSERTKNSRVSRTFGSIDN